LPPGPANAPTNVAESERCVGEIAEQIHRNLSEKENILQQCEQSVLETDRHHTQRVIAVVIEELTRLRRMIDSISFEDVIVQEQMLLERCGEW
jgi:hypothetical protein